MAFGSAYALVFVGLAVLLFGIASISGDITSILFVEFSKSLGEYPITQVFEIGFTLLGVGALVMGVVMFYE